MPKGKGPTTQARLIIEKDGSVAKPKADSFIIEHRDEDYTCPYCLFMDKLQKFLMKKKGGAYSEKRAQCPDCGEIMQMATLTHPMTIKEFAEFMFMSMPWQRVNFTKFKDRLKERGISYEFWQAYNEVKKREGRKTVGEIYDDEYEDWEREQRAKHPEEFE